MKNIILCLSVTTLSLLIGCGGGTGDMPELGTVSGVVKINGKPTENVAVSFAPVDGGRPATGVTDANGNYQLVYSSTEMGAKVGQHDVTISSSSANIDLNALDAPMVPPETVPKEIAAIKKQVEVKAGSNTIDLEYP